MKSSDSSRTTSPQRMSCQRRSSNAPAGVSTLARRELSSASLWCRFYVNSGLVFTEQEERQDARTRSSLNSLNADAARTTASGAMVVYLFVGETPGICWMQAVKRKKRLAYFENCSVDHSFSLVRRVRRDSDANGPKRNLGTKLARLYLEVEM
jgi:hypothetical protein